jgi:hypothetical protein
MYAQRELDDATVEGVLRGGPVPADLEPLAAALSSLRERQEQPVRPSAELAARMATGDFASAVAPRPSRRSAGRHAARRRLATLPLRARIAAGSLLALGGLASATAAGALPDEAQQRMEAVIEAVTPFEFSDSSEFGQDVSDDARDGGVDGDEINERAKEQGRQPDDPGVGETPEPAVVPPGASEQPAGRSNSTPPADDSGGAGKPADGGQPADKGRPDEAGKPESADRPDELPVQPRSTD